MKARIIHTVTNAKQWAAIRELWHEVKYVDPLIVVQTHESAFLSKSGAKPFAHYVYEDKIPEGIAAVHSFHPNTTGVILRDEGVVSVAIHYRPETTGVTNAFSNAAIAVLKENGIEAMVSGHRVEANDLMFKTGETWKKFCGYSPDAARGNFGCVFTFDFNAQKIPDLYRMDTEKFRRRGSPKNVTDVVGGLHEANPALDKSVVDDVLDRMAATLGWDIVQGSFTTKEQSTIDRLAQ